MPMITYPETERNSAVLSPLEKMCRSFPQAHEKRNGWWANDDNPRFDFLEAEDGNIIVHPWTGRTVENVLQMGTPPLKQADLFARPGTWSKQQHRDRLDLMTLSHYLKLDWRFLFQLGYRDGYSYVTKAGKRMTCVKIGGYCQPDGTEHSKVRVRLATDGKFRFLWDKNTPGEIIPCGLHTLDSARRAGYLCIGEGESDYATMRFHDRPFLGIPGASGARHLDVSLLHDIPRVYLIEEPDQAKKNSETGQGFYAAMRQHLREGGYTGEIFSIRFEQATGCKDPSALHKFIYYKCFQDDETVFAAEVKAQFAEALDKAIAQAIPEGNEELDEQEDFDEEDVPPSPSMTREQWVKELLAVSGILSDSQKITLMVIILYSPIWNETGEFWWRVDADQLCKLADQPKEKFLDNLTYLEKKLGLFVKDHKLTWYTSNGAKKERCTTELYIQRAPQAWLTYPSTYHLVEGAEPPKQRGGKRTPKPTCATCGSENLDIDEIQHCRDCHAVHIVHKTDEQQDKAEAQAPVESTATVLPLESEEPEIRGSKCPPDIPSTSLCNVGQNAPLILAPEPEIQQEAAPPDLRCEVGECSALRNGYDAGKWLCRTHYDAFQVYRRQHRGAAP